MLLLFWLRAVAACIFWGTQLPKALRTRGVFSIFTSKSALRHDSVQFLISHPAKWLRTRRFSKPIVRPSRLQSHKTLEKDSVLRLFHLFAQFDLLSTDSLLWLFHCSHNCCCICPKSEVWPLNFLPSSYLFIPLHTLAAWERNVEHILVLTLYNNLQVISSPSIARTLPHTWNAHVSFLCPSHLWTLAKLILPLVQWIISILTVVVCGVEIRHRGTMEPKRKTTKGTAQVLVTGTERKTAKLLESVVYQEMSRGC